MIEFFTPVLPEPLGLDLAKLDGGGLWPAQFYGETHDGRDVYCRYRYGWLSVHVGAARGDNAAAEMPILKARLGPDLHGGLSLAQLCTYAGISINGEKPPLPDLVFEVESDLYDLSGAITFLDIRTHLSTDVIRAFLDALLRGLPEAAIIGVGHGSDYEINELTIIRNASALTGYGSYFVAGAKNAGKAVGAWRPRQPVGAVFADVFFARLGHAPLGSGNLPGTFSLSTAFRTDDTDRRATCERVAGIFRETVSLVGAGER
jgi:hypothetical protein